MKRIYSVLLVWLFVVFHISAAAPDYKAFRGSGAVTVTSNPPTGTIVIHVDAAVASVFNSLQFDVSGSAIAVKDGAVVTNLVSHESLTARKSGVSGSIQMKDSTEALSFKLLVADNMLSNMYWRLPKAGSNGIVTISADEFDGEYFQLTITPTIDIAWKSNLAVMAVGSAVITNQVIYQVTTNYNGGNLENPGSQVSNHIDFTKSILKPVTNALTTTHTWLLTNMIPYASAVITMRGNSTTTNRVIFTTVSGGTNIVWLNWPTNGTHDLDVRPNTQYAVYLQVDGTTTNVQATVVMNDAYQPFKWATMLVPVGYTRSNAIVGGTIHKQIGAYTNLNGDITALTNLALWPITGHSLTNNGDELTFEAKGKLLAGSNAFQVLMGNTTLLDTGTITNTATDYEITGRIVRTASIGQQTYVTFRWGPGAGVYWPFTNSFLVDALQTNGIANTDLKIMGASRRPFGISNMFFSVDYVPAPRL